MNNSQSVPILQTQNKSRKKHLTYLIYNSKKINNNIFRKFIPYLMILPAIVILGMFVIYPIFYMIYLSFFEWDLMQEKTFVGFENFINLFNDETFWQVTINSFKYVFLTVVLSLIISILLALYLKKDTRINRILQSISFFPYIISLVSISFIWMWLMDSDYGLLIFFLGLIGIDSIGWLDDPKVALSSLIIIAVWKSIGYNTIIIISAMKAVPNYLYEAAKLDKASEFRTFFKITLPMISPTIFFITLMNIIGSFKVFEPVNLITQGGPMNSTNTFVNMIYENGFNYYKIGYASAIGVVLMAILGVCTILYFKNLDKRVHYR